MPPRIPCICAVAPRPSSTSLRNIHISTLLHKSSPPNAFSSSNASKTSSNPFSNSPSQSSSSSTPSKYNLLNIHLKKPAPRPQDSPFRFSPIKKSPITDWEINPLQNDVSHIRLKNPVTIDPKANVDIEALDSLIEENRENYTSSNNNHNNNHKKAFGYPFDLELSKLERRYNFPLMEGQLYTPRDLSFDQFKQKRAVRKAITDNPREDPFEKLNIDPIWEYKNYSLLSHFVSSMGRILPSNKTGCSTKNQRRLSKAIRRSRALGFMPYWHRHPSLFEGKVERHNFSSEYLRATM